MGLIKNIYDRTIELDEKLKLLRSFISVNNELIVENPQILSRFNIPIKNVVLKFAIGENKNINMIVCDTEGIPMHLVKDIKNLDHFYYDGVVMIKVTGSYDEWNATYVIDSKNGTLKRLAVPVRVNNTAKTTEIGFLRTQRSPMFMSNKPQQNTAPRSANTSSRFSKLFD